MKPSQQALERNSIALTSFVALSVMMAGCSSAQNTPQVPVVPTPPVSSSASSASSTSAVSKKYSNGTFSAVGLYDSPEGQESINVGITLLDGNITDATFQGNATHGRSKMFQNLFATGFKEQVIGKSISSLTLDVVNGASLTPIGFMDAVKKIQAQAQA